MYLDIKKSDEMVSCYFGLSISVRQYHTSVSNWLFFKEEEGDYKDVAVLNNVQTGIQRVLMYHGLNCQT